MTTKKLMTKVADTTPAYGKKSEPPLKAINEMMSKQSESSSKDPLHKTPPKLKPKNTKAGASGDRQGVAGGSPVQ